MDRADRAFASLVTTALVIGAVLALPLLITLFPGILQRTLHGYSIVAVCAAALYEVGRDLPPLGLFVLAFAFVSATLGAMQLVRTLRRTRRALSTHRPIAAPHRLAAAANAAGVPDEVVCFQDARPSAYCRGLLRPQIWVSSGTVALLRERELEAVLRHEDFHRRGRDPLRILVARTLGALLFAVPLVRLLAAHFEVAKELEADRAAVRAQGTTRYLARALYALARGTLPLAPDTIAVGTWSLSRARVDQLSGSSDADLLPVIPARTHRLTVATLALALLLAFGQAARANLLPAAFLGPMISSEVHTCPLPTEGVLF